ncbi:MAG TPA: diaminopimelate decarboxylase [Streptosporangiaceae bacterium]|nr:diaminopimelate decarboxylase [Streptosporangiaceae bacterium]
MTIDMTREQVPVAIGGCDASTLARTYGTPLYAYDEDGLRGTCRGYASAFQAAWPRVSVAYACKAFATSAMLHLASEEGLGVDVMSPGELSLAIRARVPPASITYHGVAKTADEIGQAVAARAGHVVIDSIEEVDDIAAVAARLGRRQPVLARINPGVGVATDPKYCTSGGQSKFGLGIGDGMARRAVLAALAAQHLRLDGIHFHLGSQIMDSGPYVQAMKVTAAFLADLPQWRPAMVVAGGGMGVRYGDGPAAPSPGAWAAAIGGAFSHLLAPACAPDVILGIEPGRSVVAGHGSTLYTVGAVKRDSGRPDEATVVVDGGLSDNPRPLMYSAVHEVVPASVSPGQATETAHIYGRHCETDLLFGGVTLPRTSRGDVLVVRDTGAYTYCMASNYNRFARPAVVFARGGASRLVVRRETLADVLGTDLGTCA